MLTYEERTLLKLVPKRITRDVCKITCDIDSIFVKNVSEIY